LQKLVRTRSFGLRWVRNRIAEVYCTSIPKFRARIVACALIGYGCFAQQPAPESVRQAFQKALALQQHGDLQGAVAAYNRVLQIRTDIPPVYANRGVVLAGLGRYREAISNYEAALKSGENPGTRLNLGLAYYKLGDLSQAAAQFDRVRAEQSDNVQANDLATDCYLRMGENRRVIEIAEPLAAAHPEDLSIQYLLGTALIRDHQNDNGQQVIDRILKHGENAGANLLEAERAIADENYSNANSHAEKAIQEAPQLAGAHLLSGIAKEGLGGYAAAKAALRRSLELEPNGFDANLQLGALLARDADLDHARAYVETALRLRPTSAAALYQIGLIDKQTGQLDKAGQAFEQAGKAAPDWLEPHVQLASLYYRLRRPEDGAREREVVSRLSSNQAKR